MSADQSPSRRRSGSKTKNSASAGKKSRDAANETRVCQEPGCGKVCKTAGGLAAHRRAAHPTPPAIESPTQAVERALLSIDITPRRAVLAATVRKLARALEDCEPTDAAKTSKELAARMAELLSDARPTEGDDDWTEDE